MLRSKAPTGRNNKAQGGWAKKTTSPNGARQVSVLGSRCSPFSFDSFAPHAHLALRAAFGSLSRRTTLLGSALTRSRLTLVLPFGLPSAVYLVAPRSSVQVSGLSFQIFSFQVSAFSFQVFDSFAPHARLALRAAFGSLSRRTTLLGSVFCSASEVHPFSCPPPPEIKPSPF